MYGDFSRDVFHPDSRYTRVLLQQGRPLTDADWNEQTSLLLAQQRSFIRDLMNWHGTFDGGFAFKKEGDRPWELSKGHYYVDGLRCESRCDRTLTLPGANDDGIYLLFLEVWEESVNPIEDAALLEPSLADVDTSWRARVRWRLRAKRVDVDRIRRKLAPVPATGQPMFHVWDRGDFLAAVGRALVPRIEVAGGRTAVGGDSSVGLCTGSDPGATGPSWYRVEIHRGGRAVDEQGRLLGPDDVPTFKWSQVNGHQIYPVDASLMLRESGFRSRVRILGQELFEHFATDGDKYGTLREAERSGTHGWGFGKEVLAAKPEVDTLLTSDISTRDAAFVRGWREHKSIVRHTPDRAEENTRAEERAQHDASHRIDQYVSIRFLLSQQEDASHQPIEYRTGDYWLIRTDGNGRFTVNEHSSYKSGERAPARDGKLLASSALRLHCAPLGLAVRQDGRISMGHDLRHAGHFIRFGRFLPLTLSPLGGEPIEVRPAGDEQPAPPPSGPTAASPDAPPPARGAVERPSAPPLPEAASAQSLLSPAGLAELRRQVTLPQDILRRIPARSLNVTPQSATFERWLATALVSELARQDPARLLERLRRIAAPEEDWSIVEADAKKAIQVANQFAELLVSESAVRQLLA